MTYRVEYRSPARRQLRRLDAAVQMRIVAVVEKLATDPYPSGCRKLQGRPGYRLRVGDYRIVYDIHHRVVTVEIIDIGHRKDIYR